VADIRVSKSNSARTGVQGFYRVQAPGQGREGQGRDAAKLVAGRSACKHCILDTLALALVGAEAGAGAGEACYFVSPTGSCYHVKKGCSGLRSAGSVTATGHAANRRPCSLCCGNSPRRLRPRHSLPTPEHKRHAVLRRPRRTVLPHHEEPFEPPPVDSVAGVTDVGARWPCSLC